MTKIETIAILAGAGQFPITIAESAAGSSVRVVAICLKGFCDSDFEPLAVSTHWVELGQVQRIIDICKETGATSLTMAGRVPHKSIFQYRHFDKRALKLLAKAANRKADTLLAVLAADFESEGIRVMDSSKYLKSLMPEAGYLTSGRELTDEERSDIVFAHPIAKVVAGQDIGQSIVVRDGVVVAVEAMEGTDECIARASQIAGQGCVLMKVSKPQQDLRFDVPVLGLPTIENAARHGFRVVAFSGGKCLVFDRERLVAHAEAAGIVVVAIDDETGEPGVGPAGNRAKN